MNTFPNFLPAPKTGGYHEDDCWVWCGCAVEEAGVGFHLYASRWRKDYPMLEGYVLFSEIVHAFSRNMEGPYHFVNKVLPAHPIEVWDGRMAHNPTVVQYGEKYLLYYIGSTYPGDPTPAQKLREDRSLVNLCYAQIRIGMAVSDSPAGPWKVLDKPILEARPGAFDQSIVTNPAPCVLPDGRIYLYYRTNTPQGLRIGLAIAERPEGPYLRSDKPVMEDINVEDPFVWHDGTKFQMLAKDMNGSLTGQVHAGAHFLSQDGIHWSCTGRAYSRSVLFDNGERILLGSLERPQVLFGSDGLPRALFAAAADGPGGFSCACNTWNQVLPLKNK